MLFSSRQASHVREIFGEFRKKHPQACDLLGRSVARSDRRTAGLQRPRVEQAENWFYSRYDSTMLSQRTFKFEHLLEQFDDSTDIYDVLQPIKMITMVQIKKQGGNLPKNQIVLFQFSIQDNYEMVGSEWIED